MKVKIGFSTGAGWSDGKLTEVVDGKQEEYCDKGLVLSFYSDMYRKLSSELGLILRQNNLTTLIRNKSTNLLTSNRNKFRNS